MRFKFKPLILLAIIPLLNSCINNADFDQVDVNLDPIFNVPLVFFEVNQFDFLDDTNGAEIPIIADITDIDIFQSTTVINNLERVDLILNITKEFPRSFIVNVDLLNDANIETYSFQTVSLPEGLDFLEIRENIIISENPNILNTTRMRVRLNLLASPNMPLDPDADWSIEFRSVGVFYLTF